MGTREERAVKDEQGDVSHCHSVTRSGVGRWKGDRWIRKTEMFNPFVNKKVNDNHADIIFNLGNAEMRCQVRTGKEKYLYKLNCFRSTNLDEICPRGLRQLDETVPRDIICYLMQCEKSRCGSRRL